MPDTETSSRFLLAAVALTALGLFGCDDTEPARGTERDGSSSCGSCPEGYTCGTANQLPVCRAPSGIPLFRNVFVIVMENVSRKYIDESPGTPYLHSLAAEHASGADYHGITHPSLPNYLAMVSGDTGGVGCDCNPTDSCNPDVCLVDSGLCGCFQSRPTLAEQLDAAGLSWKSYAESMGEPCRRTPTELFAPRHVPFLYFDGVTSDRATCEAHVVDFDGFARDLEGGAPVFSFITPNMVNDMHDPIDLSGDNYAVGDRWLSVHGRAIAESSTLAKGGLMIVAWDENDLSGLVEADTPLPFYLVSPYAKSGGYLGTAYADHYSLLATVEDGLALPRLGNAATATPLTEYFPEH